MEMEKTFIINITKSPTGDEITTKMAISATLEDLRNNLNEDTEEIKDEDLFLNYKNKKIKKNAEKNFSIEEIIDPKSNPKKYPEINEINIQIQQYYFIIYVDNDVLSKEEGECEKFCCSLKEKLSNFKSRLGKPYSGNNYAFLDKDGKKISQKDLEKMNIKSIITPGRDGNTPSIYMEKLTLNENEIKITHLKEEEKKEEIKKNEEKEKEIQNSLNKKSNEVNDKKIENKKEETNKEKILKNRNPNINREKKEGIYFFKDEEIQNYIHIELKSSIPNLEIFDLSNESQNAYKFINFKEDIYFSLCPIFIKEKPNKIYFGIRNSDDKKTITNEELKSKKIEITDKSNMSYDVNKKKFEIYETLNQNNIFNIFNEPKFSNKKELFLYLKKLYEFDFFKCDLISIKNATDSLNYETIIDSIMEMGIKHRLTEQLIILLNERDIDIYKASNYLEKNKEKYSYDIFSTLAPKLIHKIYKKKELKNGDINYINTNLINRQGLLCCDKNIPKSIEKKNIDDNNFIEIIKNNLGKEDFSKEDLQKSLGINITDDFILTFEHLEKIISLDKEIIKDYNLPFDLFKKIYDFGKKKADEYILTLGTLKKINQLDTLISANIPIIIQGFTSAGKSYLSRFVLEINKKKYESEVLSESITQDDLLGKEFIDDNNLIKYYPGIILEAYTEGKTIILDECDLAKPEVLSCIIGTLSKSELIINNKTYYKNDSYNVILTMNGEAKGFNEKQRNILPSHIVTKFYVLHFDEIKEKESENIFIQQLAKCNNYKNLENIQTSFINLHKKMSNEKQNIIDPIVTLRNLKNCIYFDKSNINPRIAAEISYVARFPKEEKNKYEALIKNFGDLKFEQYKKNLILKKFEDNNLIFDKNIQFEENSYLRSVYLGLIACEAGFHPLLVGKKGSGLTTLSKMIASLCYESDSEFLLFNSEISDEDLIGYYQPKIKGNKKPNNDNYKFSSFINWNKGAIYKSLEREIPVVLDDIGYAKSQILESLNSILETNVRYSDLNFKVFQHKGNDLKIDKGSNFVIIANIKEGEHIKNISKALMNRFVVIYLDEIRINENNLENLDIVEKTIDNLNLKIQNQKKIINNFDENNFHAIEEIDQNTKKNLISLLKSKKINYNIKDMIKLIEKLCLIYQKLNCEISLEDCYNLLELFGKKINIEKIEDILRKNKNEIEKNIFKKIFLDYEEAQKETDFFFYDEKEIKLNDALKMILGIILSDLSHSSVFLQGYPGSGKSCAGRFYGAKRSFNARDPIISINCNSDLTLESLVGTYSFKKSQFEFVKGPLLIAMEKGEPILLDEFNLCHESIFANLLPIFKAKVNDEITLKYVPEKIKINPGFFIIATGNFSNEKGRKEIPSFILDEMNLIKVEHFSFDKNIITKIINKTDFDSIRMVNNDEKNNQKISVDQIIKIFEALKEVTQVSFSIRQIKCLLYRFTRFQKTMEFVYIIIGYILPQLNISEELILLFLEKINEIMEYNNLDKLKDFVKSEVNMTNKGNNKYIKKGDIELNIDFDCSNYPQAALQSLFWIRMSCNENDSILSNENLLLIGPTSYKETIIKDWLKSINKYNNSQTYFITKNTEVQNLIGASSLDNEEKIGNLRIKMKENFNEYFDDFDLDDKNFYENLEAKKDININMKQSMKYIKECYDYFDILREGSKNNTDSILKTITSFNLGIVPFCFIFGKILILKGIENPQPSVIERLNSILENPKYLALTEDNQGIYNNPKIFEKIYENKNKLTLPNNPNFKIILTSRNIHRRSLSEAFKSRCTIIHCPGYKDKKYLTLELKLTDNYEKILNNNLSNFPELKKHISDFRINYKENIEFLSFIRFCKSAKNILETCKNNEYVYVSKDSQIDYKYIVGIAALRALFDKLNSEERKMKIKKYLQKGFLPEKLFKLLTEENNNDNLEFPFEIIEDKINLKTYVRSIYSNEISIQVKNVRKECLDGKIIWTRSSIDIADALLTSLASKTILILEGPPGRGKTAITERMYEFLGINYERINFSPSTKKEEIFLMVVPRLDKEKIVTENLPRSLLEILKNSKSDINYFEQGLLLDEMNLSKDELREDLYSYLGAIKNNDTKKYTGPDGTEYSNIGNIAVTITMNGSTMSNSRTSLSDSFLNLSHSFHLKNINNIN